MSKTAKIMFIIFIIALAVVIYFIMFGKKNAVITSPATTVSGTGQPVTSVTPIIREVVTVTDPSQRYIGTARPGITATAN